MKNQMIPILIINIAAFLGALANVFFKKASQQFFEIPFYTNFHLFFGLFSFSIVLALFISSFRLGGEIAVVYPAYATTYIWAAYLSYKLDGATISKAQILGILLVVLGVSIIGWSYKNS